MSFLTEELQQNNPILYIIAGNIKKEIYEGIRNVQKERIGSAGIAYVHIKEIVSKNELVELIKKAHESFMLKHYLYAGEIRVNYIIDVHDPFSLSLLEIMEKVEWVLGFLYPVGILTDVFALIDDKRTVLLEHHHKIALVLDILESVSGESSMVYLLSNVSKSVYHGDELYNIVHSIGLIALIKDYVSLKPRAGTQSRYSEDYFKKDAFKNGGYFMSIGHVNIKKPIAIIKKVLLTKMLNFMEKSDFSIDIHLPQKNIIKTSSVIRALEKDNLMSIALNVKHNIKDITHLQAVELMFNNRLDLYFALNFSHEISYDKEIQELALNFDEIANDVEAGFFAIYALTSNEGKILNIIQAAQDENDIASEKLSKTYAEWCDKKVHAINNKRCYHLAKDYLEFKWEIYIAGKTAEYLKHLKKFVTDYHLELKGMKNNIDSLIAENHRAIITLESAVPFINHSVRSFYENLLLEYLHVHREEFAEIYGKMYGYLKQDNFEKYSIILNDYITNTLLCSDIFNKPITDETADILRFNRISEDDIYGYIFDWIISNKQFNIFLKTGEKHLHSEINILLDVNSKLVSDLRKEIPNKEHINFFYVNNENEIDILYHIGSFDKNELYYSKLYKGFGGELIERN